MFPVLSTPLECGERAFLVGLALNMALSTLRLLATYQLPFLPPAPASHAPASQEVGFPLASVCGRVAEPSSETQK